MSRPIRRYDVEPSILMAYALLCRSVNILDNKCSELHYPVTILGPNIARVG